MMDTRHLRLPPRVVLLWLLVAHWHTTPALCTRVLVYRSAEPAFLQWDSDNALGWSAPNEQFDCAAKPVENAALGYLDGSLYVIGGQLEGKPSTQVKQVLLANGTVEEGRDLLLGRVRANQGKGVHTWLNRNMVVCGSAEPTDDGKENSCESVAASDWHGVRTWTYFALPFGMCGVDMATAGGQRLGDEEIAVSGGTCANGSTSNQVAKVKVFGFGETVQLPNMLRARARHSMTALGSALVVCGGEVYGDRDSWKCERLKIYPTSAKSWEYMPEIPINVGAVEKPAAYVRHIAATGDEQFMLIMSTGRVFFWDDKDGAWSDGPGLPYEVDHIGLTVIQRNTTTTTTSLKPTTTTQPTTPQPTTPQTSSSSSSSGTTTTSGQQSVVSDLWCLPVICLCNGLMLLK